MEGSVLAWQKFLGRPKQGRRCFVGGIVGCVAVDLLCQGRDQRASAQSDDPKVVLLAPSDDVEPPPHPVVDEALGIDIEVIADAKEPQKATNK